MQHSTNEPLGDETGDFCESGAGHQIANAMTHSTRVRILMAMNSPRRRLSPSRFAEESGLETQHCAYHFRQLAKFGCITLVERRQRRGRIEHIYEPLATALAWTAEWEKIKPSVKHGVLTSVMHGAVAALGTAIDNGTFESRNESHLSWNTIEVDLKGWKKMAAIFDRSLSELLRVKSECDDRIASGAASFAASYFMASFESPSMVEPLKPVKEARRHKPSTVRPTRDKQRLKRRKQRQGLNEAGRMALAMAHSTRVRILMAMNAPRRLLSAKKFADEAGLPIQHCDYHFRELEDLGCIAFVYSQQRRGATEHFYEPLKTALAWTNDWQALGPVVKQSVLASVMRGAVEALGAAIDRGTFTARDDSHMSWDTVQLDAKGWEMITSILDRALAQLTELEHECSARIAKGADFFVASFFMASFESSSTAAPLK